MCLPFKASGESLAVNEMKPHAEVNAVSGIANGLSKSLRSIQQHRLFMHEEIKNILKKQVFSIDRKALPVSYTLTKEEE